MKKEWIYCALVCMASCLGASAQTADVSADIDCLKSQAWTNGFEFVSYLSPANAKEQFDVDIAEGQPLVFAGGTLHEGGTLLTVRYDDAAIWVDERQPYQWFDGGDRLQFVRDARVWLVRDKQARTVKAVLKPCDKLKGLEEMAVSDMLRFGLAGVYKDDEGRSYAFSPTEAKAEGLGGDDPSFRFARLYHMPHYILLFRAIAYSVSKTPDGLVLLPVRPNRDGFYEPVPGAEALRLRKIAHPFRPDYPLLSEEYLTSSQLSAYAGILNEVTDYFPYKERLRAQIEQYGRMRNEVFARHGYLFKSEKWQTYFGGKRWYKGEKTDVSAELSPIEKANVELIRYLEKYAIQSLNETR